MAQALKKFKLLEQQAAEQQDPSAEALPVNKPKKKKRPDLYEHIVATFELGEEARRKRALEAKWRREEERKREEEARKREEEERRLQEERAKELERQRQEEEMRLLQEQKRKEEEEQRKMESLKQQQQVKGKDRRVNSITAKSLYEQTLQSKQAQTLQKSNSEKVVALKSGTIRDLRSKLFERKIPEEPKKVAKQKAAKAKEAKHEEKIEHVEAKMEVTSKENDPLDKILDQNKLESSNNKSFENLAPTKSKELTEKNAKKGEEEKSESSKRQSFISDFAALEKTYRILGLYREPSVVPEIEPQPVKKRHNSEGKIKNKDKVKKLNRSSITDEKKPPEASQKPVAKVDLVSKAQNDEKKNFFQELINEKKGLNAKKPSLLGPQIRKKNNLASTFEEKTSESSKRNSLAKDNVKVDGNLFSNFLNKFESEDKRAEAKLQMAKLTAQQRDFEMKKKQKEEEQRLAEIEMQKKAEEEERMELLLKAQLEEQEREMKRIEEEERLRAEYEVTLLKDGPREKKIKKVKKKKKMETTDNQDLPGPQLKLGCLTYEDNKSKFERLKKGEQLQPETRQMTKVKKLDLNPFLESFKPEEGKTNKEAPNKVNKLKKNSFIQQLEENASKQAEIKPKRLPESAANPVKKVSTEIKFESKKDKAAVKENVDSTASAEPTIMKARVSKSIEGTKKIKSKTSSTLSLFFDNTKEFLRSSKEKLYKLSKETLHEFDEVATKSQKPSTSEMQNYLLSHVLFDRQDTKKVEKKLSKEEEFEKYLDKEYKERIEQYCSLIDEKKPRRKKAKNTKKIEEKLPAIKLVEIKDLQQQLKSQFERPQNDRTNCQDEFEMLSSNHVKNIKQLLQSGNDDKEQDFLQRQERKVSNKIVGKIKILEEKEKERMKREKENQERLQKLLERELEREKQRNEKEATDDNLSSFEDKQMEEDIRLCLEDELQTLEEERQELENTEKLLMEDEHSSDESETEEDQRSKEDHIISMKEDIEVRKKLTDSKKKVLQRFKHILEKDDEVDGQTVPERNKKEIGSIRDKIETLMQLNEGNSKKQFEDNVLCGMSEVMSKVKNKFEIQEESTPILLTKSESRRKVNNNVLSKFEQFPFNHEEENEDEKVEIKSPTKEWAWKNKSPLELEMGLRELDPEKQKQEEVAKSKKHFQDIKFQELLEDINVVKERMKNRNVAKENDEKNLEMKEFMDEIQSFLTDYDDLQSEKLTPKLEKKRTNHNKNEKEVKTTPALNINKSISHLKEELLSDSNQPARKKETKLEDVNISVHQMKRKLMEAQTESPDEPKRNAVKPSKSAIVSKMSEMIQPEHKETEAAQLVKAPKLLLRSTSLETDSAGSPAKTLEELKNEQKSKTWKWKEKEHEVKEFQHFLDSNRNFGTESIKKRQQTLQDLDDELNVVETLIKNKNTDIIVQIREEKDKEFENFMKEIKSYISHDTKSAEEVEFKRGIKNYLSLIDDNEKKGPVKGPEIKHNTVNMAKQQLLREKPKESPKSSVPVQKIPKQTIESLSKASSSNVEVLKTKDVAKPQENKSLFSSLLKNKFEKKPEEESIKKIQPKGINPQIEKLKNMKSDNLTKNLQNQINNKLKTILELCEYIEGHDNLASPKMTELIHIFRTARKQGEKEELYKKFVENTKWFIKQGSRSNEQQIFKDNIQLYLEVIENPDASVNGTPKLKKHIATTINTNSKKIEIENTKLKNTALDSNRASAARPIQAASKPQLSAGNRKSLPISDISDDSSEDEIESDVDVKTLTDKELCDRFGLPFLNLPDEKERASRPSANSMVGLKDLLSKIKQTSMAKSQEPSAQPRPVKRAEEDVSNELPKMGSTSKMRNLFESQTSMDSPSPKIPSSPAISKNINRRIIERFEHGKEEEKDVDNFKPIRVQKSSTISDVTSYFTKGLTESPKLSHLSKNDNILKSTSFSKIKNAFEQGTVQNEDSEDSDTEPEYDYSPAVKAELNALHANKRVQNLFRINRSGSLGPNSPRMMRATLDEDTLRSVSDSKAAITKMFESQGPKITFGGNKPTPPSPKIAPKPKQPESNQLESRKWVFDTIQKYFDVIVEEQNEQDEALEQPASITQNVESDESDYTSAEEDGSPEPPPARQISSVPPTRKENVTSYFSKELKSRLGALRPGSQSQGNDHRQRKVSLDEYVADAARQFDELTDGSDLSLDEDMEPNHGNKSTSSYTNVNQLSRSGSSTHIRSLLSSVIHGSASNLSMATFKSNLVAHLSTKKSATLGSTRGRTGADLVGARPAFSTLNRDPGVGEDSSSEYSEYDD